MEYREVLPVSRAEAEILLRSGDVTAIIPALLSAAYHDPDWRWVQCRCLELLNHCDLDVRRVAITCLGHLARIHRTLDLGEVLPKLSLLKSDSSVCGWVEDALDDIRTYIPGR
jgi:hypothetical protein